MRVEVLWKLDGTVAESIPQGLALGGVEGDALTTYPDGAVLSTGDDAQRLLNNLQSTVLEHTFAPNHSAEGPLYLRLWALTRDGVWSTLYINRVEWD